MRNSHNEFSVDGALVCVLGHTIPSKGGETRISQGMVSLTKSAPRVLVHISASVFFFLKNIL